jgi:diadenosine tetraphosphate (Ap4A) HIT family hydrolase
MSYLWSDIEKWKAMSRKENCPVCRRLPSPIDTATIQETDASWLEAHPRVALRGTCYLLSKKHAVELFDLSDQEAFAFLRDVMRAARALKEITGATKINYEIHGNTIPHLHIHLFPRYLQDDRFRDGPINPHETEPPVYTGSEFNEFIQRMKNALGS